MTPFSVTCVNFTTEVTLCCISYLMVSMVKFHVCPCPHVGMTTRVGLVETKLVYLLYIHAIGLSMCIEYGGIPDSTHPPLMP